MKRALIRRDEILGHGAMWDRFRGIAGHTWTAFKIVAVIVAIGLAIRLGFGVAELIQDIRRDPQPFIIGLVVIVSLVMLGLFGGRGGGMHDTARELYERRLRDGPVGRD